MRKEKDIKETAETVLMNDMDFYTLEQAALKVGLGIRYLTDAINGKELKAFRRGKKLYILHNDMIEFIKNGGDALETKPKSNL